jgi:Flp pilus assembly protein TadG
MLLRRQARAGSVLIESAFVYPVLFLLILGVLLMGAAVVRYQQVSHVSREASRWASVHGNKYAQENNATAAAARDIYANSVLPQAAGWQTGSMTYTTTQDATAGTVTETGTTADGTVTVAVTWNMDAKGNADKSPTRVVTTRDASTGLAKDVAQFNTVRVTVTYSWNTGMFGRVPVSCTSVNTIFY